MSKITHIAENALALFVECKQVAASVWYCRPQHRAENGELWSACCCDVPAMRIRRCSDWYRNDNCSNPCG